MSLPVWLRPGAGGGSEIALHVQPGAARSELSGLHGEALKLRIRARPVEGAANAAVLAFVAEWLALPVRDVRLLRGDKSRQKTVWVPVPPERIPAIL